MLLKELASCPSSSPEMMGTSWSRLPAPMAAADSVTARMGTRMVRIVPARRRTARAMPKARPQAYQTRAAPARRRAALSVVSMLSWLICRMRSATLLICRKLWYRPGLSPSPK